MIEKVYSISRLIYSILLIAVLILKGLDFQINQTFFIVFLLNGILFLFADLTEIKESNKKIEIELLKNKKKDE